MSLSDQINEDIISAMKARDKEKLEALRGIKKVLIEAKTATGASGELKDEEVVKIIQKLAKQGRDSASIYKEQGRDDLYQQEAIQVEVFESYLPAMLTDKELSEAIKQIIDQVGASGMKDMGKVMGIASKTLAGKADGKDIADMVKKMLE